MLQHCLLAQRTVGPVCCPLGTVLLLPVQQSLQAEDNISNVTLATPPAGLQELQVSSLHVAV